MNAQPDNVILFPVGRLVSGDLYEAQKTDMQGNPLRINSGPNAGKDRVNYFFALAIPKTPGVQHWGHEPGWGQKIWALGNSYWPQGQAVNNPRFAWKIDDGDSQTPNEAGRKNADKEGYPGHWVLKFGSMFPTKVFDEQGNPMLQPGLIKRGFYIEVWGSVESNGNAQKPGIYLNHNMVAYRAPGKEILAGPDPRAVGFGRSPLPAGVTAAPLPGNTANLPGAPPPVPGAPPVPGNAPPAYPPPVPGAAPGGAPATPPPPVGVTPNPAFIAPPAAGAQPPVPPAAAPAAPLPPAAPAAPAQPTAAYPDPLGAPAGYRMANAAGARYESFRAQGWSDAQLVQAGHMVKL